MTRGGWLLKERVTQLGTAPGRASVARHVAAQLGPTVAPVALREFECHVY